MLVGHGLINFIGLVAAVSDWAPSWIWGPLLLALPLCLFSSCHVERLAMTEMKGVR